MKIIGMDLAINHGAAVEITDGKLTWLGYYTNKAGTAALLADAFRIPAPPRSKEFSERYPIERLSMIEKWIDKTVLVPRRPDYVGVEGYALRADHGAHQLGEVGGIIRFLLWARGVKFRIHDPIAVKMFATHDGTAQKDLVEESAKERWGVDFSKYVSGKSRETAEDLADAFSIAKLVETEVLLREGRIQLKDLHQKEIQVFNRATKANPVSLLGRDWIQNPDGSFSTSDAIKIRLDKAINKAKPKTKKLLEKIRYG